MGPPIVVILDPEFDPVSGRLKTLELGASQELPPDRRPKAFDLPQRHGVMGTALDVSDPVLLEFGLEPTDPSPVGILPTVIGEHLLGRLILSRGHPVDLDHRVRGGAAKQIGPGNEPGIVIQISNEVGVASPQPEGEDIALPHLVGRSPFEEAGPGHVPSRLAPGWRLHQARPVQSLTNGLRAGWEQKQTPQQLTDPPHPEEGVLLLDA